jgi:CDP-diacylglycerol--glycerol-3-phosphate 3-phosphatidyltransferase
MSIPNLLAVLRLILTPVAMYLILQSPGNTAYAVAGTVVFVIAALTDFADGYLARRWKITTTLGAFLDTVADKILVIGALLALVEIGTTSSWVAFIIIAREVAIMGLRRCGESRRQRSNSQRSLSPFCIWTSSLAVGVSTNGSWPLQLLSLCSPQATTSLVSERF